MYPVDDDPVEEIRRLRDAHAAKFNYDFDAIFRDLKEKERTSGCAYVSFSDKPEDPERIGERMKPTPLEIGMTGDPIVDEIRRFRDQHAAKFNYDIGAIMRDLQERERKSGREVIAPPSTPLNSSESDAAKAS